MRRFWAHIVIAATALVVMGASFFSLFTKISFNQQYTEGSEITYRLNDKFDEEAEVPVGASKDIAAVMKNRLDFLGITEYNVRTVGNDIIKVQFTEPNNLNKNNIVAYLAFNGSLALSNMDDNENYLHITADKFLKEGSKAYLDSVNSYPTVVIPVNKNSSEFQELLDKTQKQKEAGIGEKTQDKSQTDDQGNPLETTTTYLYLWYDFDEEFDTFSKTQEDNPNYDVNVARKIIMKFNIDDAYYPDGQENKLGASLNMDSDGSGSITTTEVRNAYDTARFYVNLLNADSLDYKVTYINGSQVKFIPATVESLVVNADPHQYVTFSRTFIATLIAIVLIGLLLGAIYHLSALAVGVTSLLSVFTSIAFLAFMNAEFNIAAVIALIAVAIISLASGIYYASKLKEEIYRGRTIKKANSEASRKTLMPTVDIHIVLIIIGVFTYLFGGSLMRTFSLISVVGGIISLIANLALLRILFWLNTNNTAWIGKVGLFGVDKEKLPVLSEDGTTKSEIFKGDYAKINFNKHSKIFSCVACGLFLAGLAGLITFGALNNGQPYASSKSANYSQLYVYTTDTLVTEESLTEGGLKDILIYVDDATTKPLASYVKSTANYSNTTYVAGEEKVTTYFEFTLSGNLNGETKAINSALIGSEKDTLDNVLAVYSEMNVKTDLTIKVSEAYATNAANFGGIALGSGIALALLALYFILRYKLSRGLASVITTFAFSTVGIGFFALIRVALPTTSAVVIPLVVLFSAIIAVVLMSREKEILLEDKARVVDFARRSEMIKEATSVGMNEISIIFVSLCFISLFQFAIGPAALKLTFILLTVAVIFLTVLMVKLYGPIAQFLYRWLSPVENARRKKKVKKNKNVVSATHRSREPEEAVFIGIND